MKSLIHNSKFIIHGKVIHGDGFGRKLGFPTANIDRRDYSRKKLHVKFGIYAGNIKVQGTTNKIQTWKAGVVVGPTDKTGLPKLEAHLIGFSGNLYGKKLVFELKKYIRPFKKYRNMETLQKQIAKDIVTIKKLHI